MNLRMNPLMNFELKLTLEPEVIERPEELVARGTFTNVGPDQLLLDTVPVSAPSLALTLTREGGDVVHLPPPPVPPAGDAALNRISLGAGESHTIVYENFLPQPLAPGDYQIRLRYRGEEGSFESAPVRFTRVRS